MYPAHSGTYWSIFDILNQSSNATIFYFDNIFVGTNALGPIGSHKQRFIQLGIETYFSFSNMSQRKHSIEEGWLEKIKCMVKFQYSICDMHFGIMKSFLIWRISVGIL